MIHIYRYLPQEYFSAEFLEGRIRLSTLEACRGYEDPARGDKGEGTWEYRVERAHGDWDDPELQYQASRVGIGIGPGSIGTTIENCSSYTTHPDAFLLSFTLNPSADFADGTFGSYGIKVTRPDVLFHRITSYLSRDVGIRYAKMKRVVYGDRVQVGMASDPENICFVKEPDRYADQIEIRMFWLPKKHIVVRPKQIAIGSIKDIATRMW
ncbi:hypothetical protein [Salinicola halophyticus]|uniref:hypothetical protein n=1 Tax=Salinicola halophyticus TaxID=1808881 RepID=UPI003F4656C9